MPNEVIWKAHPGPQRKALTRTDKEILYGGARGGGKTDAGMAWLLRWIGNPKYRGLIIRKDGKDLSDWVDRARIMYAGTGANFAYRPAEIKFPSGAMLRTGHLNDANAYEAYQGHEYQKMLIEELTQIPEEESYLKLISSCRSTVDGLKPQVFATTNPGGSGHGWVKERFIDVGKWGETYVEEKTGLTRVFIPAKVTDNPTLMEKDPSYIHMLEQLPDNLRKAWKDGSWDIVAGQVFTEWKQSTHVVEPFDIPPTWNHWLAMDWGTNAPFAVGWYAQDFHQHIYLYRELYMTGLDFEAAIGMPLTPKRLAKVVKMINKKNHINYQYCVVDPAMWNDAVSGKQKGGQPSGKSVAETMMKAGLKLIKADNDRVNGLERLREAIATAPDGKPFYMVFSTCRKTIQMYPSLTYDNYKINDVKKTGGDPGDHGYDRDRYFFMSRPPVPRAKDDNAESPIRKAYLRAQLGQSGSSDEVDEVY